MPLHLRRYLVVISSLPRRHVCQAQHELHLADAEPNHLTRGSGANEWTSNSSRFFHPYKWDSLASASSFAGYALTVRVLLLPQHVVGARVCPLQHTRCTLLIVRPERSTFRPRLHLRPSMCEHRNRRCTHGAGLVAIEIKRQPRLLRGSVAHHWGTCRTRIGAPSMRQVVAPAPPEVTGWPTRNRLQYCCRLHGVR